MRIVNLLGLVLFGIVAIILAPAESTGQPGGFGGKKGNKGGAIPGGGGGGFQGGGMGGMQDPNTMFDYLAKGRQFFLISETRTLAQPLTQYSQERRISNGQITRQQFLDFQDWRAKQQAAGGGGAPGGQFGGGNQGGGFGNFGKKNGGGFEKGGPPSNDPEVLNQRADEEFRKRDENNDGRLTPQEASDKLRRDFARWDADGSGTIDLNEYRTYFASRSQGGDDRGAAIIIEAEDLDAKPVVFRAGAGGKMPAGLPSWFLELDTDKDGQVALYEWRRAGKAFDDFSNWDLNGDGFITPEEALSRQTVIAKTSRGSMGAMAFGGGEEGGEGRKMKGFGGKGEGGFKGFGGGESGFKGFGGEGFKGWNKGGTDGSAERPAFPGFGGPRPSSDGSGDTGGKKKKKGG